MIREAIIKIVNKEDLTYDEAKATMLEIMRGETTPTQNAAFLAALSTKSTRAETIDEISGCAEAMRSLATPVPHPGMEVLEIVGTGGDNAHSFNISTTAAMVIAAAGVKVAKHGNRAASSLSGTADCLEALGVNIRQDPDKCLEMLKEAGFCFMFAQQYHSAMKYVGPIRKELGFRTVFNILGPLTNPAKPEYFLLGVYDEYLVEPVAKVLASLGVKKALVVYGQDKLDEISISAPTTICELRDGFYRTSVIAPEDFGLVRGTKDEIVGGTPEENAQITRGILDGKIQGSRRGIVLLNAGAALYTAGKTASIGDGVKLAADQLAAHARERVEADKKKVSPDEMRERALLLPADRSEATGFPFEKALKKEGISFICECKKASPSKGLIAPDFPYLAIAEEYEDAGADAVSVLTEPKWFLGSDRYLEEIAAAVRIPVLRKDFTVDPYMIFQAKTLGASAVLLICAILSEEEVREGIKTADRLGMSALVEAHSAEEIGEALRAGARIIGVNNRNLRDFSVDTGNSTSLRRLVPRDVLFVAESGIKTPEDVRAMQEIGADAVLVGEALMRAPDKKAALKHLRGENG